VRKNKEYNLGLHEGKDAQPTPQQTERASELRQSKAHTESKRLEIPYPNK
jgi:hypothetical protein